MDTLFTRCVLNQFNCVRVKDACIGKSLRKFTLHKSVSRLPIPAFINLLLGKNKKSGMNTLKEIVLKA